MKEESEIHNPKEKVIGYATGVFDLFHIGHLNVLKNSKSMCDELIVGVTTDELVAELKGRPPVIPFPERVEIIKHLSFVDSVVPQAVIDEIQDYHRLGFHRIFKGGWKGTEKWNTLEKRFSELGVEVVHFPYTETTSSTLIRKVLDELHDKL